MPVLDNASHNFLTDLQDVLQEQYWTRFEDQTFRKGSATNRLIPFAKDGDAEVVGDGLNIQVQSGLADTARISNDVHSEFPTPRNFKASKIKLRYNEDTPGSNDFGVINTGAKVTHPQTKAGGKGAVIDTAKKVFRDIMEDYDEKLAIYRNLTRTGRIALVNGTPKQNDTHLFSSAAATPTNSTGARFPIDGGPIAMLDHPGFHFDIWDPTNTTYSAQNVRVTDANVAPNDLSVGVAFDSTGDDQSIGDLADIADNDEIYFSGGKGFGLHSLESWFERPSSGDSFIGGLDRTNADYRWLLPVSIREGDSSTQIQPSHLDDLGDSMHFRTDASNMTVVVRAYTKIITSLRSRLDANGFVQFDPGKERGERRFTFGAMGVDFQHPTFGMITLMGDSYAPVDKVELVVPDDWRSFYWGWKGLEFIPGDVGPWYVPDNDSGTARAKVFQCSAYTMLCDACLRPSRQGQILNVTA